MALFWRSKAQKNRGTDKNGSNILRFSPHSDPFGGWASGNLTAFLGPFLWKFLYNFRGTSFYSNGPPAGFGSNPAGTLSIHPAL